jgi:competence ComEA-like helix-hairpin-helix protein
MNLITAVTMYSRIASNLQTRSEDRRDGRLLVLLIIGVFLCSIYCFRHASVVQSASPNHCMLQWTGTDIAVKTMNRDESEMKGTETLATLPADLIPFFFAPLPINEADQHLLETIPGIGPRLAQDIIRIRIEQGPFRSPEDLLKVPGIGVKRMQKFAEQFSYR